MPFSQDNKLKRKFYKFAPCDINHFESKSFHEYYILQVSWMRLKDITAISMNENVHVRDSRIKILHVPESDR